MGEEILLFQVSFLKLWYVFAICYRLQQTKGYLQIEVLVPLVPPSNLVARNVARALAGSEATRGGSVFEARGLANLVQAAGLVADADQEHGLVGVLEQI